MLGIGGFAAMVSKELFCPKETLVVSSNIIIPLPHYICNIGFQKGEFCVLTLLFLCEMLHMEKQSSLLLSSYHSRRFTSIDGKISTCFWKICHEIGQYATCSVLGKCLTSISIMPT